MGRAEAAGGSSAGRGAGRARRGRRRRRPGRAGPLTGVARGVGAELRSRAAAASSCRRGVRSRSRRRCGGARSRRCRRRWRDRARCAAALRDGPVHGGTRAAASEPGAAACPMQRGAGDSPGPPLPGATACVPRTCLRPLRSPGPRGSRGAAARKRALGHRHEAVSSHRGHRPGWALCPGTGLCCTQAPLHTRVHACACRKHNQTQPHKRAPCIG